MSIALGSDHAGFDLKSAIIRHLEKIGREYKDYGVYSEESADYPDLAAAVSTAVQNGKSDFGIVICGTGIGVSIAANKHVGIRAALCAESYSARCAREHNNANVLALGSRVTGVGLAVEIVDVFLEASFEGGRHLRRIEKIDRIEQIENNKRE